MSDVMKDGSLGAAPRATREQSAMSAYRAGLIGVLMLGGWHLLWSAIVATGLAQPLMDFIFWLHFIRPVYVIEAFDPVRALGLVLLTAILGYAIGGVLALLWNRIRH